MVVLRPTKSLSLLAGDLRTDENGGMGYWNTTLCDENRGNTSNYIARGIAWYCMRGTGDTYLGPSNAKWAAYSRLAVNNNSLQDAGFLFRGSRLCRFVDTYCELPGFQRILI